MVKVSPSILAADFACLANDIRAVQDADMLHLDIMDGHFVPNISFGVPVVASVRKATGMFLDVHLMLTDPGAYVEAFCLAGADLICFHLESDGDPQYLIRKIRSLGKSAAISLKPGTPVEKVFPYVPMLDMVLIMTVEPGFGGQEFISGMMEKVTALRLFAQHANPALDIQVDGGINRQTAKEAVAAGANVLVAGSCIFGAENPASEVAYYASLG